MVDGSVGAAFFAGIVSPLHARRQRSCKNMANRHRREALRGAEPQILDLLVANRHRREALRGAEAQILDLFADGMTPEQWAQLLKCPLERAAGQGKQGLARKLAEAGARIGDALHKAVRGGHGKVVYDLLDQGASINARDTNTGETPLHFAAAAGNTEMVQLLMLSGADVNLPCGPDKRSLVHTAAEQGQVDILRAAIEHGAEVDAVDVLQKTALHLAAARDEAEAINVLVEAGVNIEARTDFGASALHFSAGNLNWNASFALLEHGANANARKGDHFAPLFYTVVQAGSRGTAEVVDLLLKFGADETDIDGSGKAAADAVAGDAWEAQDLLADDVERVRKLLRNAPADRAWRRRGYLVLCRAHPDRMHQSQQQTRNAPSDTRQGTCSGARADTSACSETERGSATEEEVCCGWADVVPKVLGLQEEGIFRTIVGYL